MYKFDRIARRLTLVLALAAPAAVAGAQSVVRLPGRGGHPFSGMGDRSRIVDFSPGNRHVLLNTWDDAVMPGDDNGCDDAFWLDRWTGQCWRAVYGPGGLPPNGGVAPVRTTVDGRLTLFVSSATNLGPVTTYDRFNVFVIDNLTGLVELVGLGAQGQEPAASTWDAEISDDGRCVAFVSEALNLGGVDPLHPTDAVYVRERVTGAFECVSLSPGGTPGDGWHQSPRLSADGRYVAFISSSTNLVPNDTNGGADVFLRDRSSGTTVRVNLGPGGVQDDSWVNSFDMTPDGRWIAFESYATTLHPEASTGTGQVYLFDRSNGTLGIVSRSSTGAVGDNNSWRPLLSDDARYVTFFSTATNFDPLGGYDVYRRDLSTGTTIPISRSTSGAAGVPVDPGWSDLGVMSRDGRLISFWSNYNGYVAGDIDGQTDHFIWEESSLCPPIESYCTAKVDSHGCKPSITSSGEPYVSGPTDSFFVSASSVWPNRNGALLWSLQADATPFAGGMRCVAAPSTHAPVQSAFEDVHSASACPGSYAFHFSRAYMIAMGIGPGTTVHAQYWSRDPGFAPPDNLGLSDGLRFTTSP